MQGGSERSTNINNRIKAFYGRQSVDRKDSISIESQLEFALHEFGGKAFKKYTDKGYSGKNTDRPKFQELVRDIERGLISDVVVYKLDRISRSIVDFAKMMEMFQQHHVEFISATEKFDTSTPMGRAMLNICIVFAQLERETIQRRVQDAYYSRCEKGFHMSGVAPYGYKLEETVIGGIKTKKLVTDPVAAEQVRLMFAMYSEPNTSFGDIIRYLANQGISISGGEFHRSTLSKLLHNPVYAQADLELYKFFKTQGASITNDASDFSGMNGCYLIQGRGVSERKESSLKDQIVVVAPHEGLIPSETWLSCRKRLMNNVTVGGERKAKNTWLAGKIKCGRCGMALLAPSTSVGKHSFRCQRRTTSMNCEGCGKLSVGDVEDSVYKEMCHKMAVFNTLTRTNTSKTNPKLTAANVALAQVETEIEKLIDSLAGASSMLMSYANSRIEELDSKRQLLAKQIADLTVDTVSPKQVEHISNYLDNWADVGFEDRRTVVDGLITKINAIRGKIDIEWKF